MTDTARDRLVAAWKDRRKGLRRQAIWDLPNKRLLYARADELKQCYEALAAVADTDLTAG